MSLKTFHIVFISLSCLLMAGYSAWCFREYIATTDFEFLVFAILSLFVSAGLVLYGNRFLKKLRHVSFL
jgi:hypothetical protein